MTTASTCENSKSVVAADVCVASVGGESLPLEILVSPARIEVFGRPIGVDTWHRLAGLVTDSATALRELVEMPIDATLRPGPADLDSGCFGIEIGSDGGAAAWVTVDEPAARALADAVEARIADVRGAGELTDAELGFLEFAALCVVDAAARRLPALGRRGAVRGFLSGTELARCIGSAGGTGIPIRLRIGAREGSAAVWLARGGEAEAIVRDVRPLELETEERTGDVELSIALSPVAVDAGELARGAPGDVLLLGVDTLESAASRARLVTSTGWRLAEVSLERVFPDHVRVRVGPIAPVPDTLPAASGERRLVEPRLGRVRIDLRRLRGWGDDEPLDLELDADGPFRLFHRGLHLGTGEPVLLDGDLGVRLLSFEAPGEMAS